MDLRTRTMIFLTFVFTSVGLALVASALATQHFTSADPFYNGTVDYNLSTTDRSYVHFGLFYGERAINTGILGIRRSHIDVRDEIRNGSSPFDLSLWLCIILFSVLSLFWSCVSLIFSLINTVMRPIETIFGPLGLYFWNSLALFSAFISALLYMIEHFLHLTHNVLLPEHISLGWSTENTAKLDYSFWLLVGSLPFFALNILLLLLAGLEMRSYSYRGKNDKQVPMVDASLFLY